MAKGKIIKRALCSSSPLMVYGATGLAGGLAYGLIRRAVSSYPYSSFSLAGAVISASVIYFYRKGGCRL